MSIGRNVRASYILKAGITLLLLSGLSVAVWAGGASERAPVSEEAERIFEGQSGTIEIAGGTAHIPVVEAAARQITTANPSVRVTVAGGGTGVGIESVGRGQVDIGSTGRAPTQAEIERYDLHPYRFALDGVTAIVHPSSPVRNLSTQELAAVFSGRVTNWADLGGEAGVINVFTRDEASATQSVFVGEALGGVSISAAANVVPSNGAMKAAVSRDPGAIGFVGIGYVDSDVRALSLNGVEPTQQNAVDGLYPVVRGLYFNTSGEPSQLVESFYRYLETEEGAELIRGAGYIPTGGR